MSVHAGVLDDEVIALLQERSDAIDHDGRRADAEQQIDVGMACDDIRGGIRGGVNVDADHPAIRAVNWSKSEKNSADPPWRVPVAWHLQDAQPRATFGKSLSLYASLPIIAAEAPSQRFRSTARLAVGDTCVTRLRHPSDSIAADGTMIRYLADAMEELTPRGVRSSGMEVIHTRLRFTGLGFYLPYGTA